MTELIFHIGMNKCASTTFQKQVFPGEPGFIGKFLNEDSSEDFGLQFENLSPVGGRQTGNVKGVSEWLERVKESTAKKYPTLNRYIVSSESLCQSNKISEKPVIPFLLKINQEVLKVGTVKVIIVFRNQADMLASNYAQNSAFTYNYSQRNFESSATNLLSEKRRSQLDWGGWAQELIHAFGRDHVCILLLEEINTIGFWENLVNFIDAQELSAQNLYEKSFSNNKNKRRIDDKEWKLTPFSLSDKSRIDVLKFFNFLWTPNKMPALRERTMKKSIETRKKYLELKGFRDGKLVDPSIKLSGDLREKIQANFSESNKILSEILDKDLKELGY